MLIDFWATWCPPCQAPMAHNVAMLASRGKDWEGKARIIGLSIDQDKNKLKSHVEAKKWESVEHYFRAGSDASDVYGVRGVPHVMLIDTKGRIVFKGHPATRKNLEEDIDTLIKGEALTGEGVFSGEPKKEEGGATAAAELPEGYKSVDAAAINAEIDAFTAVGTALQADEKIKEHAKKMPRAFCVMVFNQQYVPKTGETHGKYENFRVLVGPKDDLEATKAILDERVKGSFEVVLREQAM